MNRLKELRTSKGLLQKDMAAHLGIDRTTYVKYESEASEPSNDVLCMLADFFDVSVDYLLGRTGTSPHPIIRDEDIKFALFGGENEITDEQFEEVKRYARYIKEREAIDKRNPS